MCCKCCYSTAVIVKNIDGIKFYTQKTSVHETLRFSTLSYECKSRSKSLLKLLAWYRMCFQYVS